MSSVSFFFLLFKQGLYQARVIVGNGTSEFAGESDFGVSLNVLKF